LLPDLFCHQEKLETLDLSFNNIEHFQINVEHMKNLTTLYLQHNSIHSLHINLRNVLVDNAERDRKPFEVDLRNNSITFSCFNLDFLQWLNKYQANITRFNEMVFIDEDGHLVSADKFLAEISQFPRTCNKYTWEIVSVLSASLPLFVS